MMDKDLNAHIEFIEKTIDLVAKEDDETTSTLECIYSALKKWGCQGSDFIQIKEELAAMSLKHQRSRDEIKALKEERKLVRKALDEKVVSLKKEIDDIQANNHEIQDKMNNDLPLVLKLMKGSE